MEIAHGLLPDWATQKSHDAPSVQHFRSRIQRPDIAHSGKQLPLTAILSTENEPRVERPRIEGERPAALRRQVGEAHHAGAIQTLFDHLIEREGAALTRRRFIGEGDDGRVQAFGLRAVSMAGRPVAARAMRGIERLARPHALARRGRPGDARREEEQQQPVFSCPLRRSGDGCEDRSTIRCRQMRPRSSLRFPDPRPRMIR